MANIRKVRYKKLGGDIPMPRNNNLTSSTIRKALDQTNAVFVELTSVVPHVYELLGLRNLSAIVGAAFAKELQDASKDLLLLNPHQDGYPDLLLMDQTGKAAMQKIGVDNRSKDPFSPFPEGGIEVKATCGDVPSAKQLVARGGNKPLIGEERIDIVAAFNWKAHHRATNNLLGLLWDFVDGLPTITAVTFSNELEEKDWGKLVQPRKGGGRTTSVSTMVKSGVSKMLSNVIFVIDDDRYEKKINKIAGNKIPDN